MNYYEWLIEHGHVTVSEKPLEQHAYRGNVIVRFHSGAYGFGMVLTRSPAMGGTGLLFGKGKQFQFRSVLEDEVENVYRFVGDELEARRAYLDCCQNRKEIGL